MAAAAQMEAITAALQGLLVGVQALQAAPAQPPVAPNVPAGPGPQEMRDTMRALLAQTAQPDGTDPKVTRRWLTDVGMAPVPRQMEVAAKSARGTLRKAVEAQIALGILAVPGTERHAVPWEPVRIHVQGHFLGPQDQALQRSELANMKQGAYEDALVFSRRFREVAESAYPTMPWHAQEERDIVRGFIRGLATESMSEELALRVRPATLAGAENALAQLQAAAREYGMLSERTKKVSAVGGAPPGIAPSQAETPGARSATQPGASHPTELARLEAQVASLSKRLGEVAAFNAPPRRDNPPKKAGPAPAKKSQLPRGAAPVPARMATDGPRTRGPCWTCGGEHLRRECPQTPPAAAGVPSYSRAARGQGPRPTNNNNTGRQGNLNTGAYPSRQ